MKKIAILGSTGSIGMQALDVIRNNPHRFTVAALACHSSIDIIEKQVREFVVPVVAVEDTAKARELRERVPGLTVLEGMKGVEEIAAMDGLSMVLNALVGSAGIGPTVAALGRGTAVALANKETLVAAGERVMIMARENGAAIFPVDSEHSAIFQCLNGESPASARKLILTCSGGPFRKTPAQKMQSITPEQALKHPKWNMGRKISIDSATLMNKGLEVIEASVLFGMDLDRIQVLIHPQSVIHSMVEFTDGSVMAQMGPADMRLPIQYALTYPERSEGSSEPLDLAALGEMHFENPDPGRFPCLSLAYEAGKAGGSLPCVMNAANEICVQAFLAGAISFTDIPLIIRKEMDSHLPVGSPDIDEILEIDRETKKKLKKQLIPA